MTAAEVGWYLVKGLEEAGLEIRNERSFIDERRNIVVEWNGGSSDFWARLSKPDMMNRIKHSIQNHARFWLRRTGKETPDGDGQ